jgi:hypothetical protein
MPVYDICYMNEDGSLACTLAALCRDDLHAKVLAHAMKLSACKQFEVWRGQRLVYERPQYFGVASVLPDDDLVIQKCPLDRSPAQQPFA